MKLQDFSGGLSTRLRPQFISATEGAVYTNINHRVGSLAPSKVQLKTDIASSDYAIWYDHANVWLSGGTPADVVEFQNNLYIADRLNIPTWYDGTDYRELGIAAPDTVVTTTADTNVEAPVDVTTISVPVTAGGLPQQDERYTIVNTDGTNYSRALQITVAASGRVQINRPNASVDLPPLYEVIGENPADSGFRPGGSDFYQPTVVHNGSTSGRRTIRIAGVSGITYGSTGVKVYRLYQGKYRLVGTMMNPSDTILDDTPNISAAEEFDTGNFGKVQGVVQYMVTYYSTVTGIESGPSEPSVELDMSDTGTVVLTNIPVSADPQVDTIRIYRIGNFITEWTLVDEIPNGTTSYNDVLSDTELDGRLLDTLGDAQAPVGLGFLTDAYAMLFGAVGPTLHFTPIAQPYNWPTLNTISYESDITGIAAVATGLLVMTKYKTHLVTGTGPASLATQVLSNDQGCLEHRSIAGVSGAAVWISSDGICTSFGDFPKLVSRAKLGKLSLTPVDAVVFDEVYYVLDSYGVLHSWDFGNGGKFSKFTPNIRSLVVGEDKLYGPNEGFLHELFASEQNDNMSYTSPRFFEGSATAIKAYKKIYFYSKGDIIIEIYIDDIKVASYSTNNIDGLHTFQIPVDKQRGNYLQYTVSGTGEMFELEYSASG